MLSLIMLRRLVLAVLALSLVGVCAVQSGANAAVFPSNPMFDGGE